jgi:putative ABC transport system ATP-binding protein
VIGDLMVLQGVHKSYHLGETRVSALRGVDLAIPRGEFLAIGGPSGSGKSTLLNICGLLDKPDQGRYLLEGREMAALSHDELAEVRRGHLGFIFQSFNLVPVMTAAENVEYPLLLLGMERRQRQQRVAETLAAVGLADFGLHLPDRLSGGQRQRVAIARALVKHPSLVIADEPTANLDTATASQIIDMMQGLGNEQGTTFLIATHDERMIHRCHRMCHLTDGILQ